MNHPMHRPHQENLSPRPEEWLEARWATSTRLIKIILSQGLRQCDYGLMLKLQSGEQVAIGLMAAPVRPGSRSSFSL